MFVAQNQKVLQTWPNAMNAEESTPIRISGPCIPPFNNQTNLRVHCTILDRTPTGNGVINVVGAAVDPTFVDDNKTETIIGPVSSARCFVQPLYASGPVNVSLTVDQPGRPPVISENLIYPMSPIIDATVSYVVNGRSITVVWKPSSIKWPDGSAVSHVRVELQVFFLQSKYWTTIRSSQVLPNNGSVQTYTMNIIIYPWDPFDLPLTIVRPQIKSTDLYGPSIAAKPFCGSLLFNNLSLHQSNCLKWHSTPSEHQSVYPDSLPSPCPPLESQAKSDPSFVMLMSRMQAYKVQSVLRSNTFLNTE